MSIVYGIHVVNSLVRLNVNLSKMVVSEIHELLGELLNEGLRPRRICSRIYLLIREFRHAVSSIPFVLNHISVLEPDYKGTNENKLEEEMWNRNPVKKLNNS